jgi:hypothetical protein
VLRRRQLLAGALVGLFAGCVDDPGESPTARSAGRQSGPPPATEVTATGYTHHRATGNRVVDGAGAVPNVTPVDVAVEGRPAWVVGVPAGEAGASAWAVVTVDGGLTGLRVEGTDIERFSLPPGELPSGTPPLLLGGDPPRVSGHPAGDAATLTHPVPLEQGWLYVAESGDLMLVGDGDRESLALDAPTDARIVTAGGRAFVLADATDRYAHAVLGDGVEGGSVAVVDLDEGLSLRSRIRPPGEGVVEGLAATLADVTGDGSADVLVTVSGDGGGARLVAYRPDGTRVAASETLAAGWRHQLAVAPFGDGDRPEVAAVKQPHVAHELQFFARERDALQVVASHTGYQSHAIGSRNLDAAVAGDLDGDGALEVLVPRTSRDTLAAVRRTADGTEEPWTVPVGGDLTTNVGAVSAAGRVTVAAGHDGGVRFWPGP